MSNAVAIRTHTQPGDEIIAEEHSHLYVYEGGGYAVYPMLDCIPLETMGWLILRMSVNGYGNQRAVKVTSPMLP